MFTIKTNRLINLLGQQNEEKRILIIYRYLSLAGTSLLYFINNNDHSIIQKLFIIVCISISGTILTYLYIKNEKSKNNIAILVFIETIGNSFILIPSGGLGSPYIWYAINTILITSLKLRKRYSLINIILYFIALTTISYLAFNQIEIGLMELIERQGNLLLSFILISVAMHQLAMLLRTSEKKSKKLKESMEHTMTLYQSVHTFSNYKDDVGLLKLLISHTKKITKTKTVFFLSFESNKIILESKNINCEALREKITNRISYERERILGSGKTLKIDLENRSFIIKTVSSSYKTYGILGIEALSNSMEYRENVDQLKFLADLASIILEKIDLEKVNERLLVTEEQNRIANEIHDSILQRLFSMSCYIFALMKNIDKLSTDKLKEELNQIRETTNNVMHDLRATIYDLSWKNNGINTFKEDIESYINEIRHLNNTNIELDMKGNHEYLSSRQKKAIYRIICEGIGNAIRHGKSNNVEIKLYIEPDKNELEIIDDGIGFNTYNEMEEKKNGLGLRNIQYLVQSHNGNLNIDSELGKGTTISIIMPNNIQVLRKEEVV